MRENSQRNDKEAEVRLNVKDRVSMRNNDEFKGMIVAIDRCTSRCMVLWDQDWRTGRTFYYYVRELKGV